MLSAKRRSGGHGSTMFTVSERKALAVILTFLPVGTNRPRFV
jgi:hypothetical protein